MILSRQKFDFHGRVLIEKVSVRTPFRLEVIFQNEGCFLYVSGSSPFFNAPDQRVQLSSMESVLLKCGSYVVDWLKSAGESVTLVYAVHLYPDILKSIYRNELPRFILEKNKKEFIRKIIPENTISKFIESLDFYFGNPGLVTEELLELKVKELILILIQTKNADSVLELISGLFTKRKASLREVINTHLYSGLSVSKLAELCNMSESSFKREFRDIYEDTPIHYINSKRLERAKELLLISDQAVSTIAYELGFSDPAYFSRLFKKKFAVAPSSLR